MHKHWLLVNSIVWYLCVCVCWLQIWHNITWLMLPLDTIENQETETYIHPTIYRHVDMPGPEIVTLFQLIH